MTITLLHKLFVQHLVQQELLGSAKIPRKHYSRTKETAFSTSQTFVPLPLLIFVIKRNQTTTYFLIPKKEKKKKKRFISA